MNWYLVLFGFLGIVVVFFAELYKTKWKNMNWPAAAIRYGVAVVLLFAIVHWHTAKQVQGFLTFAGIGALAYVINSLSKKL